MLTFINFEIVKTKLNLSFSNFCVEWGVGVVKDSSRFNFTNEVYFKVFTSSKSY